MKNRANKHKEEVEELVHRLTEIVKSDSDSGSGKAVEGLMVSLWGIIRHKQSAITEQAMAQLVSELGKKFEEIHRRLDVIEQSDHDGGGGQQ